jgi:hypothetical protein
MNKQDKKVSRSKLENEEISPVFLATCDTLNKLMDDDARSLDPWHQIGKTVEANVLKIEQYLEARGDDAEDPYWVRHMRDTVRRYRRERVRVKRSVPQPLTPEQMAGAEAAFEL